MAMRAPPAFLGLVIAAATVSCNEAGVQYEAKFAPGFQAGPTTVSVFGVYQEGRMSTESWHEIDARLAPVLGKPSCDVLYGALLRSHDPELLDQVDRSSQQEGITEDLLDRFSSAAEGDAILVVSLRIKGASGSPTSAANTPDATGLMGRGGMPGSRYRGAPPAPIRLNASYRDAEIRLAATLFSAKKHTSMARLTFVYQSTNLEEAIQKFAAKIGEALPGSVCKGWKLDGKDEHEAPK
jgi:hypothetical protein